MAKYAIKVPMEESWVYVCTDYVTPVVALYDTYDEALKVAKAFKKYEVVEYEPGN